jgi:hypothetical protein
VSRLGAAEIRRFRGHLTAEKSTLQTQSRQAEAAAITLFLHHRMEIFFTMRQA